MEDTDGSSLTAKVITGTFEDGGSEPFIPGSEPPPAPTTEPAKVDPPTDPATPPPTEPASDPAKPEGDPADPEKKDKLSRGFAIIARRERQLREDRAKFEADAKSLTEARNEIKKGDPKAAIAFLQKHFDLDYEKLTLALAGKTPEMKPEEIRAKIKEEVIAEIKAERETSKETEGQKQLDAEIAAYTEDCQSMLAESADDSFEYLKARPDGAQIVRNVMWEHLKRTGKVLEPEAAAKFAEDFLDKQADGLLGLKKVQAKFGKKSEPPTKPAPEKSQTTTLSNDKTSAPTAPNPVVFKSPEEKRKHILSQNQIFKQE